MKTRIPHLVRLISVLLIAVSLTSCKDIEKLVEQGRYDEAIAIASKRLAGKTKKKQKFVTGLEQAFVRAQKRDMSIIESLEGRTHPENWTKIHAHASDIAHRQSLVEPLLPLVDQYGYKANFEFVRVNVILNEAADGAAQYLYAKGMSFVDDARNGDKLSARNAYKYFEDVSDYRTDYIDVHSMMSEMRELGTTYIALNIVNETYDYLPGLLESRMLDYFGFDETGNWRVLHVDPTGDFNYDYEVQLVYENIDVSPNLFEEHVHHFERTITETHYVKDTNGKIVRDSTGKQLTYTEDVVVKATVWEVFQEKVTQVSGTMYIRDLRENRIVDTEPVSAVIEFENQASRMRGDRRALNGRSFNFGEPVDFPEDEEMILDASNQLKPAVVDFAMSNRRLI